MSSPRKSHGKRQRAKWLSRWFSQITFGRGAAIAVLAGLCVGVWLRAWLM